MERKVVQYPHPTLQSQVYPPLERGCSVAIPVEMKNERNQPINLTGYKIGFTIKPKAFDFDRDDDFAIVVKEFEPQDPTHGRFHIDLTSRDMDFEPGSYFFDVIIFNDEGVVSRLICMKFELFGGPTNRYVNDNTGCFNVGQRLKLISILRGHSVLVITPQIGFPDTRYHELEQRIKELEEKIEQIQEGNNGTTDEHSGIHSSDGTG